MVQYSGGFNDYHSTSRGFTSLQDEKEQIKKALQSTPSERSIWHPIGMGWFLKWKTYVNFDDAVPEPRDPKEIENFHPGPIDNSGIKGNFGDELRRDIVEGQDFVLLPKLQGDRLFQKYGGGPQFPREAINTGSYYSPLIQINLFPTRLELYLCDKRQPIPTRESKTHFLIRYYVKNALFSNVVEDMKTKFSLDFFSEVRCWIRDPEHSPYKTALYKDTEEATEGSSNKKQRVGRMLTADQVEWDGEWRYMHKLNKTLSDLLGTKDCIEAIIETASRNAKDSEWPRFAQLEKWKNDLRVGDMIDAQDSGKQWYEAVIKDIDNQGNIHVHYKGWGTNFDESIPANQKNYRIKPLHTYSEDRSTWEEGDSVELNIASRHQNPVWLPVKIVGQDLQADRILVQYSSKVKRENLQKFLTTESNNNSSATAAVVSDDDLMKKRFGINESKDLTDDEGEDGTSTAKDNDENDDDEDRVIKEWYDLYGDEICALYTHTDKPKPSHYSAMYESALTRSSYTSTSPMGYSSMGRSYYSHYDYDRNSKGTPPVNGAVGLQNLGNTCFMNSILQCLSNTEMLCQLFTTGNYKDQINYDNPLGHNGKVALSYGKLMKEIWSNAYTLVVPREFKNTIGEFRPQFAGTEQQDSQEFMNFLLDGLHEDLNRIVKKPHVQKIESKGRDDALISSESWRRFLLRNDSELVDHYFGQLKSHVTCVNCGNISVTFDEYSSISLPIPIRNTKTFHILVQLLPLGSPPMRVSLEVEITATMTQLKKLLIDRLIELGVILETSNSLSTSPVPPPVPPTATTSHKTNGNNTNEEGFEMIPSEQEGEEDFEMVNDKSIKSPPSSEAVSSPMELSDESNPHNTNTNNNNLPTPPPFAAPSESKYDRYHFHFGTIFSSRPATVFKNYNSAEAGSTAIQAFIGKMDTLMAFQLEHEVPDFKGYAYSSSYNSYGSYNNNRDKTPPVPPKAFAIDIAMAVKGNYNRLDLMGYPCRFTVSKEQTITNHEIHLLVHQYLRRFLSDDVEDNTAWPYELVVTNSYATQIKRVIEDDNSLFEDFLEGSELLVITWTNTAVHQKMINEQQVKYVRDSDPKKTATTAETTTKSSGSIYDIDEDDTTTTTSEGKRITIYDCLDKFIEREQLNETETLYCSNCKQHLAPIKKMDIYSAPDILIIHLKRFQFIPGQYFVHREKITEVIDFPITGLDLTKYVIGRQDPNSPPIYDLYGVSHHMGGLGGGHYIATCKNFVNNKWYKFNDSTVSETSEQSIVSGTAYVLFYKRRSGTLRWGGIVPNPNPLPDED